MTVAPAEARGRKRDFERQIRQCDISLESVPGDANAYRRRGEAYRKLGHLEKAISDFDAALALDPDSVLALAGRGGAKRSLGRHEEAARDFDAALKLEPRNAAVLVGRGAARRALGRLADAKADLDRAIALGLRSPFALQHRGEIHRKLGKYAEAVVDYDAALTVQPHYVAALAGRGAAKRASGCYDEAVADFTAALALEPRNAAVLADRGLTQLGLQRPREAAADFASALRLDPRSDFAKWGRGAASEMQEGAVLLRTLTLSGFTDTRLNTRYTERRDMKTIVNDVETYWSTDGAFFLFWCSKQSRWKGSRASDLEKNRQGGSSAMVSGPEDVDLLDPALSQGWFEWNSVAWSKNPMAGVSSLGPTVALPRLVRLAGFVATPALNGRFIEQRHRALLNGHPTFWSGAGEHFLFWCKKEHRWKGSKRDSFVKNRSGGSSALVAAPLEADILSGAPLPGWHEWMGSTWVKQSRAGVVAVAA